MLVRSKYLFQETEDCFVGEQVLVLTLHHPRVPLFTHPNKRNSIFTKIHIFYSTVFKPLLEWKRILFSLFALPHPLFWLSCWFIQYNFQNRAIEYYSRLTRAVEKSDLKKQSQKLCDIFGKKALSVPEYYWHKVYGPVFHNQLQQTLVPGLKYILQ